MSPKVRTDSDQDRTRRHQASRDAVRATVARAVRLVFGVMATILALGAILVVLRNSVNEQNSVVRSITDVADSIAGPLSRTDGVFTFDGKNALSKDALLNWGIAAIVYLLIGRVLGNFIAPKGGR